MPHSPASSSEQAGGEQQQGRSKAASRAMAASGRSRLPPPPPPPPNPITDPVGVVTFGGRLPPARRLVISGLSATAIIIGSNFLGSTSLLLGLDGGKTAAALKLDVLVPVNGSRRCYDAQNGAAVGDALLSGPAVASWRCMHGLLLPLPCRRLLFTTCSTPPPPIPGYTFLYPSRWLADQTLYRRYAERIEAQAALDPTQPGAGARKARGRARAHRRVWSGRQHGCV